MKHLFSVSGIVFVLSIDKIQLCNAVKGFYGSEHINANEYLRRFIDLEFVIPSPNTSSFCKYLYELYKYDEFFVSIERKKYPRLNSDKDDFLQYSISIFDKNKLTLRQQEKIYLHARVVLNLLPDNNYLFPELFILLISIRFFNFNLFMRIKNTQLSIQELMTETRSYFLSDSKDNNINHQSYTAALLYHLYNNSYAKDHYGSKLYEDRSDNQAPHLLYSLDLSTEEANDFLLKSLQHLSSSEYRRMKLDYLLDIIDLTENLTMK
ncbi:MAG: hypothetical protein IPM69_19800 [Ignavibacteria bacterium]|nr:hypothetical protein [Ignavibacteria bacterium]